MSVRGGGGVSSGYYRFRLIWLDLRDVVGRWVHQHGVPVGGVEASRKLDADHLMVA